MALSKKLPYELKNRIEWAAPFMLTFAPIALTPEDRRKLESWLASNFDRWAASWLWPIACEMATRADIPADEFRLAETEAQRVIKRHQT